MVTVIVEVDIMFHGNNLHFRKGSQQDISGRRNFIRNITWKRHVGKEMEGNSLNLDYSMIIRGNEV